MASEFLVDVGFGAPKRQNRWSVAFRLILALPHFIRLIVVTIVAEILMVVGWFYALVMGRLPQSFANFISRFVTYQVRVSSYIWLMNSEYPPFSGTRPFTVSVDIPRSRVRRLAVLFRIFLIIPAAIVNTLVSGGMAVAGVFIWLIVLVNGSMPLSLFGAIAATIRFQARYLSYWAMLTSQYPGELFGDKASPSDGTTAMVSVQPSAPNPGMASSGSVVQPASPAAVDGATASSETPDVAARSDDQSPSTPAPRRGWDNPTWAPTPGVNTPVLPPTGPPQGLSYGYEPPTTARLVLNRAAKRILVVFLCLGALAQAAGVVLDLSLAGKAVAFNSYVVAHNQLVNDLATSQEQHAACVATPLSCQRQYFSALGDDLAQFELSMAFISFPSSASADARKLENVASQFSSGAYKLAALKSEVTTKQVNHLDGIGQLFDTLSNQLVSDLTSPI